MTRDLSPAEDQGWRRFWDGWIICPPCIETKLAEDKAWHIARREAYNETWGVPADYDTPIGEAHLEYDSGCCRCGAKPPLLLTWKTQVA